MSDKKKTEERLLDVFELQARVHATLSWPNTFYN